MLSGLLAAPLGAIDDVMAAPVLAQAGLTVWELVAGLFNALLPFLLILVLLAGFFNYYGLFEELGLSGKEIGLLLVGGASTLLVDAFTSLANVPIFAYGNALLMVNIGGAIIPVVVAIHLIHANRLNLLAVLFMIAVTSGLSWWLTSYDPEIGVYAEFPDFLLPPAVAALGSLLFYGRASAKAPAMGYATATFGALIGADLVRIPLFLSGEFAGSIGGAGIFDLVYLSGLIAFTLNLIFAAAVLRTKRDRIAAARSLADGVTMSRRKARRAVALRRWQLAAMRELDAVHFKARQAAGFLGVKGYPRDLLAQLLAPQWMAQHDEVARIANDSATGQHAALRAQALSGAIIGEMDGLLSRYYAGPGKRVAAFLVDFVLIAAAGVGVFLFTVNVGTGVERTLLLVTAFLLAWNLQLLYFTLFEYFGNGRTIGKALLGLQVRSAELTRVDFISVFTRNVVRLLDMFFFAYAASLVLIGSTKRKQRIGDMVAKTVVVDHRARERMGLPREIEVFRRAAPAASPAGPAPVQG